MAYNILVIGAGGREHALAVKIKESAFTKKTLLYSFYLFKR